MYTDAIEKVGHGAHSLAGAHDGGYHEGGLGAPRCQIPAAPPDPPCMTLTAALAATHTVQLGLHGDRGSLCLEHRLVGTPDDDCLTELVGAARATYARLHAGEAPEETNVNIEPLSTEERDAELRTTERGMAHALGFDDPDIDFYAD